MKLNISSIQPFSVGDGDGIRTTLFFKGCNMHCPWCHNPETISPKPQLLRFSNSCREQYYGFEMDIEEVMCEILKDKDYYIESGGGVTLSGGEVMLQADAAAELSRLLKTEDVSVFIDTAGNVLYSCFEKLNPYADKYLFDWKAANEDDYQKLGGNFHQIYANLTRLIAEKKSVCVRIPLIPDFNTSPEYMVIMCELLKKAGVQQVDLLPFHRLGSGKYSAMGKSYAYRDVLPLSKDAVKQIADYYSEHFRVTVEK